MKQKPETRNLLSMWGTSNTGTVEYDVPPVTRNYFVLPGLIKKIVKPAPYHRQSGKISGLQFSPEVIKETVLLALEISSKELKKRARHDNVIDARCIVTWLCNKYAFDTGMGAIARLICRDRTTAIYMVQRANNFIETREQAFIEKLQLAETRLLNL